MRPDEKNKIIADTISGASVGGTIAGAGGILSGLAMTTSTSTSWLIFTTTATTVAPWAVAGFIVGGAVVAGVASAIISKRGIDDVNGQFEKKGKQ